MRRLTLLLAVGLVGVVAGCGGGSGSGYSAPAPPSEDPATAMTRVIRHELAGRRSDSYKLLVTEQQAAIDPKLYEGCAAGPPLTQVEIKILGVHDEQVAVPAIGKTTTKAVRWQMTVHDGGAPFTLARTGHLVAQGGTWHWTLSKESYSSFLKGTCP